MREADAEVSLFRVDACEMRRELDGHVMGIHVMVLVTELGGEGRGEEGR